MYRALNRLDSSPACFSNKSACLRIHLAMSFRPLLDILGASIIVITAADLSFTVPLYFLMGFRVVDGWLVKWDGLIHFL